MQDCDIYFKNAEELIIFEENLFNEILEENDGLMFIGKDIKRLLFEKLLNNYRQTFVSSQLGLESFITTKNYNALKRMKRLYARYESNYNIIKEGYLAVVIKLSMAIIDQLKKMISEEEDKKKKEDLKKNPTLISKLMVVYKEQDKIIKECFNKHFDFKIMLVKALENCLNIKDLGFSMPFLIALYTSDILKKSSKTMEDNENTLIMDGIVTFLSCLEEKDKYLYYLSVFMSKRLLDKDLESLNMLQWDRYLVQVIKAKLGPEITKNFEAMLQDVQLCYEKKYEFKHFLENSGKEVADNDKMDLESDMIKQQPQSQTHLQNLPAVCVTVLSKCEW